MKLAIALVLFGVILLISPQCHAQLGGPGLETHGDGSIDEVKLLVEGQEEDSPAQYEDGDGISVTSSATCTNNETYTVKFILEIKIYEYHHASGELEEHATRTGTAELVLEPGDPLPATLDAILAEYTTNDPEQPWPGGFRVHVRLKSYRVANGDEFGGEELDNDLDKYFKRDRGY